jgi:hypothetical protein
MSKIADCVIAHRPLISTRHFIPLGQMAGFEVNTTLAFKASTAHPNFLGLQTEAEK